MEDFFLWPKLHIFMYFSTPAMEKTCQARDWASGCIRNIIEIFKVQESTFACTKLKPKADLYDPHSTYFRTTSTERIQKFGDDLVLLGFTTGRLLQLTPARNPAFPTTTVSFQLERNFSTYRKGTNLCGVKLSRFGKKGFHS